jgi:GDP-L-fucose synthase
MSKIKRIYIAGHSGMVGSAITRQLKLQPDIDIITQTRRELDLCNQTQVDRFFQSREIDHVYLAAAKVGGILANNNFPAEFIYQNLMIETNIINSAYKANVNKLLFLGSSCIYPRLAKQPIEENELLNGELEPTNEAYAIAKIAGIKLCEAYNKQYDVDYRSAMPSNLYGPNDNFHPKNSHVIPGLINRFHDAKVKNLPEVIVWGSGKPLREFLHVDDLAKACVYLLNLNRSKYESCTNKNLSHVNIGTGSDVTIAQLAQIIAKVIGFKGEIVFDTSKPDGTPRKLMSIEKIKALGWQAEYDLETGLKQTYAWFLNNTKRNLN